MTDKGRQTLDLERARRNWDRAAPVETALPERIAAVPAPVDPYPEARRLLARVTVLAKAQFPKNQRGLAPFLSEAESLLSRMEAAGKPGAQEKKDDVATLRDQLQKVLDDLEDLFEVYAGIGLP